MTTSDPQQPFEELGVLRIYGTFILFAALSLLGCGDVTCDADSVEVASARQLSQARLQQVANDVDELLRGNSKPAGSLWTVSEEGVPEQFQDIGVVVSRVTPIDVRLRLKGCMDHHVDLVVTGSVAGSDRIELWFGEGPTSGKEVLWEAVATPLRAE